LPNDSIKFNFLDNELTGEDFEQINLDQNSYHDLKNELNNVFINNPFTKSYSFLNVHNSDAVDTFR
jgi:hypothetical protein